MRFITWGKKRRGPSVTPQREICQLRRRPENNRSRRRGTGGTVGYRWVSREEASRAGRITSAWKSHEAIPRILRISRTSGITYGCTSGLADQLAASPRENDASCPVLLQIVEGTDVGIPRLRGDVLSGFARRSRSVSPNVVRRGTRR